MSKIILVSGSHRSGSTWIGKIISSSPEVRYIHEPFNVVMDYENYPFKYWFEYIHPGTEKSLQEKVENYLKSFLKFPAKKLLNQFFRIRSIDNAKYFFNDLKERVGTRPLIKDPIAIMSCEWIYKKFNCDVVISIRHPAAFIASVKVKGWQFDFNDILRQEDLMDTYLQNYKAQITDYAKEKQETLYQAILLWNIIYTVVFEYQKKYSNQWYFIKHEDLSRNPIEEFSKMFKILKLGFPDQVKKEIISTTTAKIETDSKRNAIENITSWKTRLTEDEINLIKESTRREWTNFYTEDDWK